MTARTEAPSPQPPTAPTPGEFRARLDARGSSRAPEHRKAREDSHGRGSRHGRPGHGEPDAGANPWLRRPDGSLVLAGTHPAPAPPRTHASSVPARSGAMENRGAGDRGRNAALTDVHVGRSGSAVHLHARLGEGRHAGVEIRAVAHHGGRVSIEIHAPAAQAEALRDQLGEVRRALALRGVEGASVDVRQGDSQGKHHDERETETAVRVDARDDGERVSTENSPDELAAAGDGVVL